MPSFWLEYDNNGDIQEFPFDSESVTVGRDKSSDFVLDHSTVSRQHAIILYDRGEFRLVVLSQGGLTAIDGQQVDGDVKLYDGSVLNFGKLQFRFRSHEAPQKPAPRQQQQQAARPQQGAQNQFGGGQSQNQFGGGQSQNQFGGGQSQNQFDGGQPGFGHTSGVGGAASSEGADGMPGEGEAGDSGIVSWDEIANSAEALEDSPQQKEMSIQERMKASKKEEKTNPLLVVVAGAAIIGLMWFTFFNEPVTSDTADGGEKPVAEQPPLALEVQCMGEQACMQKAKSAYQVGVEKLDKKDVAIANLFEGYKKLKETQAYLEKAGKEPTKEMADMQKRIDDARAELDGIFRNYRVNYKKAEKKNLNRDMLQSINTIKAYFPDPTAREHRWANSRELEMKRKGIMPPKTYR